MFVRPRRVFTGGVNDAKDRVGTHKIPRKHRVAVFVTGKSGRINRGAAAIWATRRNAVEEILIQVDSFLIFRPRADGRGARSARSRGNAITGGLRRWIQRSVIGQIVKNAFGAGRPAAHDGG
jgi:hypothetical protein